MIKSGVLTAILLFVCVIPAFTFGKRDVTEQSVDQNESWQETFDINHKKQGKYNIMVTATDKGGNEAISGPYNIYIDPESDLPIAGITNPLPAMRVPGNLNIVGTCIDDDGVDKVELIFDGDTNNPKQASGKEFWSYYLDTTQLSEGPHTIEVYGTDINGLKGHSKTITWNLDRRQPVTVVSNYGLGTLVSGKIDLKGTISDGNGIRSLAYSLDGGTSFSDVKIHENVKEKNWEFSVPVDTKKAKDGPAVCWFKATDQMGSVGVYSFLYFIDNTTPDVQIVSPKKDEICNGKFAVAGYAKDIVGLKSLTWAFGGETGEFELIPGNPYWYKEIDTTGISGKTTEFSITAIDTAGNVNVVKQAILLNQELDKPTVTIEYPPADTAVEGDAGKLFLRGIAADDDGVASIAYHLDAQEDQTLSTTGVFTVPLSVDKDLPAGKHTVTVIATDMYGVQGHPLTVSFIAKGSAPVFSNAAIQTQSQSIPVVSGMSVNPESGSFFKTEAHADCGISHVSWTMEWGADGLSSQDVIQKGPEGTIPVIIPLSDTPWGLVRISVSATDIYGRITTQTSALNITDLTRIHADTPSVLFDDTTVTENGVIHNDPEHPVTGYFIGGTAKSVELVPSTSFAKVSLSGNSIRLEAGKGIGASQPVKVRITTDQGLTYDSRPLTFTFDVSAPVVTIAENDPSSPTPLDGTGPVHISGKVESSVQLTEAGYRILSAQAVLNGDFVTGVMPVVIPDTLTPITVSSSGSFSFDLDNSVLPEGLFAVEIIARNGKEGSGVVFVRKIPALPALSGDGKKVSGPSRPVFSWFDGSDVYYTVTYQGSIDHSCGIFNRSEMTPGNPELSASVKDETGKLYTSKYVTKKDGDMTVRFDTVCGSPYESGMSVVLNQGGKDPSSSIVASVESDFPVTSAVYSVDGPDVPGGDKTQEGKALVAKIDDRHFEISFPIWNLPARLTKISLTVQNGNTLPVTCSGTIAVVRSKETAQIDDEKKIYWLPVEPITYDTSEKRYIIASGTAFTGYANVPGPVTASISGKHDGLTVTTEGNSVFLNPSTDGLYKGVTVTVRDSQGIEYKAPSFDLLVDSNPPAVEITAPAAQQWVKTDSELLVTASDENGIKTVEYSLDGGLSWAPCSAVAAANNKKNSSTLSTKDHYSAHLSLSDRDDGIIGIDVRVTDVAGKISRAETVIQKDTTPPTVDVIIPGAQDVVNGENRIAFIAKDAGQLVRAEYVGPQKGKTPSAPVDVTLAPMITTLIGTPEQPINDLMVFNFYDAAGNVTTVNKWDFLIDAKSDLPLAEVHLPEENAVITRDFVISGVIYDDDGPSKLWYKIDDNPYTSLPDYSTSFSLDIPLKSMTDNEHKVTVYAEDIHGVVGPEFVRNFRISLEEPKGRVETPPISKTVRGTVTITGSASDKNGISKVQVSVDNGNTFNDAVGKYGHEMTSTDWSYTFDTRIIQDGTHVVFVKIFDDYGIEGLYSSLINIDNTAPKISLELPLDDSRTTGMVFFSGQTTDNIGLTDLYITIRSLDGKIVSNKLSRTDLVPGEIITQAIDLSSLENGFYNVELSGSDAANNITRVSRNIQLNKAAPVAKVDLLYPLNGEHMQGVFNIYGTAVSEKTIDGLSLFVDDKEVAQTTLSASGYYKFSLGPDSIAEGQHRIKVIATLSDSKKIVSNDQTLIYRSIGPWVTIDNFTYGDFAIDRPYLTGTAGYAISEDELVASRVKGASKDAKAAVSSKSVDKIEISFDNGKTFQLVSKSGKWRYRIENEDIAEGYHFLLVRATMKNGETAITRTIVQVDKTAPVIRLISPGEGGHYNQELIFSGLTSDDVALKSVTLALRKGDKASYEVPGFIQGLYFDWQFWGATLFNMGAGLTFFDDNVKLQVQWGQFTQTQRDIFTQTNMRYGGDNVFGAKILANVAYIPFRYFLGPDWEWLSANIAVGANFTRFNESGSGKAQILSAVLTQLEFPRITFARQKMFRTIALYTEGQIWFIPTDVSSSVDIQNMVPQVSVGLRVNVF